MNFFQYIGKVFCVEYGWVPWSIPNQNSWPHIEDMALYTTLKFQSFDIQEPVCVFDPPPLYTISQTDISSGRFY